MIRPEQWILIPKAAITRARETVRAAVNRHSTKQAPPAPISKFTRLMIEAGLFTALLMLAILIAFAVVLIASE